MDGNKFYAAIYGVSERLTEFKAENMKKALVDGKKSYYTDRREGAKYRL